MTTEAAAQLYLSQHLYELEDKGYAVHNPKNLSLEELPVIYGFNNGGSRDWWNACLISQDGIFLGSHCCSHEGYMKHDLGILEGSRPDRHETFKEYYPEGYRMDFVSYEETKDHKKLQAAFKQHREKNESV